MTQGWCCQDLDNGPISGWELAPACGAGTASCAPNVSSYWFCLRVMLCVAGIASPENRADFHNWFFILSLSHVFERGVMK